jgi:hypothetical protein
VLGEDAVDQRPVGYITLVELPVRREPDPRCTENNVYVHSNQPYTDATASADGYSWSYETNSSGYAVIYLNGPPASAQVTVKVGSATCTATWT